MMMAAPTRPAAGSEPRLIIRIKIIMNDESVKLIERLEGEGTLAKPEFARLLADHQNPEPARVLADMAMAARRRYFDNDVFLRGLIEFTNYCKNDCLYCGIRRSNHNSERYRLTLGQILDRCAVGHKLGLRTFVLQGGEDPFFTDDKLVEMVSAIKARHPDCAVTLSVGEKNPETYVRLFTAGADRYLLRHETADRLHYSALHPAAMSFDNRRNCLFELKKIGFQVGAGFMVGSPGQTYEQLAEDFVFLKELSPQMVGIGPFIPHPQTPLGHHPPGSGELTVFILGLVRLMLPKTLLPATTALGTLMPEGREKGLAFGANVIMPNLSPPDVRRKYDIYTGKIHLDEEAAEDLNRLKAHLADLGFAVPRVRGDYPTA